MLNHVLLLDVSTGKNIASHIKENAALQLIDELLRPNGKSLCDYPSLPQLSDTPRFDVNNHMVLQELAHDREQLHGEAVRLVKDLNSGQKHIYDHVMHALQSKSNGFFFVHGYGGTGKTFLWSALTAAIRAEGGIVLAVASSGIAATLLPTGRTAHSRFAIPIDINESSTCSIGQNTPLGELLRVTSLIIWDEAPMVQRYCLEAFDRTLRDIMQCDSPFGGKCVVLGGDFRQILPVIPKGARATVVDACINSSYLWRACKIFHLTQNMRLKGTSSLEGQAELTHFSQWLLDIGEGRVGSSLDGVSCVAIPQKLLVKSAGNPIASLVEEIYKGLLENIDSNDYFNSRAILAPTIAVVNEVNKYMLSLLPG